MYAFTRQSPIGLLFITLTERGLRGLHTLSTQRYVDGMPDSVAETGGMPASAEEVIAQEVETQLRQYFDGSRTAFDLPLDLDRGSAFQRRVWEVIARIPYGEVLSYVSLPAYDPNDFAGGIDSVTWASLNTDTLKPLQRIRDDMRRLERGETQHIDNQGPQEISPLIAELNRLADS